MVRRDGPRKARPRGTGESGQTILIVAVALVVLILAAGLAVDMGYLRYQRRLAQTAADSAAIAGAGQIVACNAGSVMCQSVQTEAQTNSSYNGFTDGTDQTTVTISNPPADGPHAGDNNYVEAFIARSVPSFFMKILGPSFLSYSISSRAVAYPGPGPSCIYALQGIEMGGPTPIGVAINAPTCTFVDGGDLNLNQASHKLITSGTVYAGGYTNGTGGFAVVTPTPVKGTAPGNPLAYLSAAPPSMGAGATPCGLYTYCQGNYPSGIQISGGSTVTFQPGTYVLGGNGLTISGSGGTVTGTGVTFYISDPGGAVSINDNENYDSDHCTATLSNFGNTVQLSAPLDTGLLFIQSQNNPSTITLNNGDTCNAQSINPSSYAWGVLYFPTAQLTLNGTGLDEDGGCSATPRFTIVVANILYPEGDLNFSVSDCDGPPTPFTFPNPLPDPIKDAILVE